MMYDLDKVLNFARYGVMAEHVDCLMDFSKSAATTCEVIVRNPFRDAAIRREREIEDRDGAGNKDVVRNRSPIAPPPAPHHRPYILPAITPVNIPYSTAAQTQPSTLQPPIIIPQSPTRPPRATCTFCGKSFGHLGDYNKHRRRHTGERPYACDSCPRRFAHASNLQRHRRLHSGEKPFECVTCTKRFSRKDKLAAHVARRCCRAPTTTTTTTTSVA